MSNWTADWLNINGIFDGHINFPASVIDRNSVVLASVTEIQEVQGEDYYQPFKGDAVFTCHNVVPYDNGTVEMTIDTGWTATLINVRAYIAVNPS